MDIQQLEKGLFTKRILRDGRTQALIEKDKTLIQWIYRALEIKLTMRIKV